MIALADLISLGLFQYRKRYEITCDIEKTNFSGANVTFQYRKRYEITCDTKVLPL